MKHSKNTTRHHIAILIVLLFIGITVVASIKGDIDLVYTQLVPVLTMVIGFYFGKQ
jgi:hypothetical protein